jgi:hypothetical protein
MLNKCIDIYKKHTLRVYPNVKATFLIPGPAKPCPVRVIARLRGGGGRWSINVAHDGMMARKGKPKDLGENTSVVLLFPQQTSREVTQNWNQGSAMRSLNCGTTIVHPTCNWGKSFAYDNAFKVCTTEHAVRTCTIVLARSWPLDLQRITYVQRT